MSSTVTAPRTDSAGILRLGAPIGAAMVGAVLLPLLVFAILGWLSSDALYVRSLYIPLSQLFVALIVAFDASTQTAVARAVGARRTDDLSGLMWTSIALSFAFGAALTVVVVVTAPALADLLHVAPHARELFIGFVRWTSAASALLMLPIAPAALLRGSGRSGAAAVITLGGALVELSAVAALAYGTGLGVWSVPVSMAMATAVALTIAAWQLRRSGLIKSPRRGTVNREALVYLRRVGLPVAGTFVALFGFSTAQLWIMGPFGESRVSGFSLAVTLQAVLIQPALAIGAASAIMINQRLGAGERSRLLPSLWAGLRVVLWVYIPLSAAVWLLTPGMAGLLTNDTAAAAEAARYLRIVGPSYLFMGMTLAAFTVLEQIGKGLLGLCLNVVFFAALSVIGYLVTRGDGGPADFYWALSIGNVGGVLATLVAVVAVRHLARAGTRERQ
ncbi:MATE family efflux transporter [Actinoplanes sp. NPDC051475]|uniref:MATE family efflux transporter n=1 Tax=Actinoplanes sp. NPDC051475 TaxID=3157225 RepID=UPI00344F5519